MILSNVKYIQLVFSQILISIYEIIFFRLSTVNRKSRSKKKIQDFDFEVITITNRKINRFGIDIKKRFQGPSYMLYLLDV
jgi:hypothetical protein